MDQLWVHKHEECRALCAELDIEPCFNGSYLPDYNPIEFAFSNVKAFYKKAKLQELAKDNEIDVEALAR